MRLARLKPDVGPLKYIMPSVKSFARYLQFGASIAFAIAAALSPWAQVAYRLGDTGEQLLISVSFWNDSLRINGCPRGSVAGEDQLLDKWLLFGKVAFLSQIGLWLAFIFAIVRRQRWGETAAWLAGLPLLLIVLIAWVDPYVECLYDELQPPLVFLSRWQIDVTGALLSSASLVSGAWASVSVRKSLAAV